MDRRDLQHLAVALLALAILLGAYWLMSELRRSGQLEECLMQRRRNCEQLLAR